MLTLEQVVQDAKAKVLAMEYRLPRLIKANAPASIGLNPELADEWLHENLSLEELFDYELHKLAGAAGIKNPAWIQRERLIKLLQYPVPKVPPFDAACAEAREHQNSLDASVDGENYNHQGVVDSGIKIQ